MQEIATRFTLLLALGLAPPASLAQVIAPDVLLRSVAQEVLGRIQLDADLQAGNPVKVAALIEGVVLPLFDFDRMTRSAMARHWRLASPDQKMALVAGFKTLLTRTYCGALANYRGETFEFKPLRTTSGEDEVTVKSELKRPSKDKLRLDFDMESTSAGWRIYDVKIVGVRLVSTYRDAFAEEIRNGGIDGLILALSVTNQRGDSRFNAARPSFWERSQLFYAIFRGVFERPL